MFVEFPREIGLLARSLAFHQRILWRISGRVSLPTDESLNGNSTVIKWITDHIQLEPENLKFKIALCHLHSITGFEDDWPKTEPHQALRDLLNSPKIALQPLMHWYWRGYQMNLPKLIADNIFINALKQCVKKVKLETQKEFIKVQFESKGCYETCGELPLEIKNELWNHLQTSILYANPLNFPTSAPHLHNHGVKPVFEIETSSTMIIELLDDRNWIKEFGLTPEDLIEHARTPQEQ